MPKKKPTTRKTAAAKSAASGKSTSALRNKTAARKPAAKAIPKKAAAKKTAAKKTGEKKAVKKKPPVKKAVAKKPAKKAGIQARTKGATKTASGRKPADKKKAGSAARVTAAAKSKASAKGKPSTKKKTALKKQSQPRTKSAPARKTPARKTATKSKVSTAKRSDEAVKEAAKKVSRKDAASTGKGSGRKTQLRRKTSEKRADTKKKSTRNISFSLDEALEIANQSETNGERGAADSTRKPARGSANGKRIVNEEITSDNSVHGAASVADILGYDPDGGAGPRSEIDRIPKKYHRYYKLLVELRDHVVSELDLHTKDTLKRSAKEDSGDLSSYSQHLADAGTDTFDRDFALSLVSSEQEALYEIEEAIQRIRTDTYGVCEMTGKPIKKERLLAVPFARFSLEGQVEYERTHRKSTQRGGAFAESGEETVKFLEEEADE